MMPAPDKDARPRQRLQIALIAVLLIVAGVGWHIHHSLSGLPQLRTVELKRGDLRMFIAATGTVEPNEVIEVGALASGMVTGFGDGQSTRSNTVAAPNHSALRSTPVRVGTRVVKGGVLAQLDRELYEIELQKAVSSQRLAEAEIARLQTRLSQSTRALQRAEQLRQTNSESQYEQIATGHQIAMGDLEIAKAKLEQALGLVQQAEVNLARTTIRSPVDGVVIDHRIHLGQQATPSSPGLFLITQDLKLMRLRTSVSETDIGKVYPGQPVSFTVDGYRDAKLSGQVDQLLMNARVQGNFVTYDVLVTIGPHDVQLLPHMTADVQLETVHRQNAWLVPSESLEWTPTPELGGNQDPIAEKLIDSDQSKAVIWVAEADGRVRAVPVSVGVDDGVRTEILGDGFDASMPVVVGTIRETTLARIIPSVRTLR